MKPLLKVVESSAFRIEKGVAIPHSARGDILYPFADMSKGDSFLVPATTEADRRRIANRLGKQRKLFAKRFGLEYEFTSRRVEGGLRCWRVK